MKKLTDTFTKLLDRCCQPVFGRVSDRFGAHVAVFLAIKSEVVSSFTLACLWSSWPKCGGRLWSESLSGYWAASSSLAIVRWVAAFCVCVCADVILWSVAGIQCLTTFDIAMNEWYGFKGKKDCLWSRHGMLISKSKKQDIQPHDLPRKIDLPIKHQKTIIPSMSKNTVEIMCSSKASKSLRNPERFNNKTSDISLIISDQIQSQTSYI